MKKVLIAVMTTLAVVICFSLSPFADAKDKTIVLQGRDAKAGIINSAGKIQTISRIYISRAEFIAQLKNALGININYFAAPDISKVFSDVKNDDKFADEIYDMYSVGIVDDTGKFRPNDKLTREEAVHYIVRAYNYKNKAEQISPDKSQKSVKPVIRGYLKDISQAQRLGFIGKERVSAFKNYITRAEALSLIKRVGKLGDIQKQSQEVELKPTYSFTSSSLSLSAQVVNNSAEAVTINFSSGHQIDFILLDGSNNEIYNSSRGKMFTQTLTNIVLKPGESKIFSAELSNISNKDIVDSAVLMKVRLFGTINGKEIKEETVRLVRFLGPPTKKPAVSVSSWASLDTKNLEMGVTLTNNNNSKISFNYQPGRLFDYVLLDENKNEVYRWSAGRMFPMIMMKLEMNPGEVKQFKEVLSYPENSEVIDKAKYLKVEVKSNIDGITFASPELVEIQKLHR